LPIFTEVQGYGKNLSELTFLTEKETKGSPEDADSDMRGFESDEDDDIDEPSGIRGMTLQLVELLTTLV
jgi:hypothetical protein